MKTKTYEIEVVYTYRVKVTLPEVMGSEELTKEWERSLWKLDGGIESIAEYAATVVCVAPDRCHDGIGRVITDSWVRPDYDGNHYQVVAIVETEDVEEEVLSQSHWIEIDGD